MEWKGIQSFLIKSFKVFNSQELSRRDLMEAIKNFTKADIPIDDIKIKDGVAYINTHPLIRNEIIIHQKEILSSYKDKNPNSQIFKLA